MSQLNVLISGAGIAGSVAAYWLAKGGANVTVVEQAPALRLSGQGIDLRGKAIDIIRKMGIEDEIRSKTTKEVGTTFVDDANTTLATMDVSGDQNFTAEIEIMRPDLAQILHAAALSTGKVNYEFNTTITTLSQTSTHVHVEFSNPHAPRDFDLLVAADGFTSKTRPLILPPSTSRSATLSLDTYVAYFTIPSTPADPPRSRWFTTTRRRAATLRPVTPAQTSAYLTVISTDPAHREVQTSASLPRQKSHFTALFADAGWELPRILSAMATCPPDAFYMQEIGQIRLAPSDWHRGRAALVGDAAYAPSPFTGMGTTLAVLGAYVLAGEVVRAARDGRGVEDAFRAYEDVLGAYVKDVQKLPFGGRGVALLNPETAWGVWVLRWVLWLVDRSGLARVSSLLGEVKTEGVRVPEYVF